MYNLENLLNDGLAVEVIPSLLYFATTSVRPPPAVPHKIGDKPSDTKLPHGQETKQQEEPKASPQSSNGLRRPRTAESLQQAGWASLTGATASRPTTAMFDRDIPVEHGYSAAHVSAAPPAQSPASPRGRRLGEAGSPAQPMDATLEMQLREALTEDNGNGGGCAAQGDGFYFSTYGDEDFVYHPFFADFGPLDLGSTVRFARRIARMLAITAGYRWEPRDAPSDRPPGATGGASRPVTAPGQPGRRAGAGVGPSRPQTGPTGAANQKRVDGSDGVKWETQSYVLRPPPSSDDDDDDVEECSSTSQGGHRSYPRVPLVFCTSMKAHERTNAATLIGAFCVCALGWEGTQVQECFLRKCFPPLMPYRDAGSGASNYPLSVTDVLRGMERAVELRWLDIHTFNLEDFERAKTVWDYTWIVPGKLLAFSSPEDSNPQRTAQRYAELFTGLDVRRVIKLNESLYKADSFVRVGIRHTDLEFPDGSAPLDTVLKTFLQVIEEQYGERAPSNTVGMKPSSAQTLEAYSAGGRRRGLPPAATTAIADLHNTGDKDVVAHNPFLRANGGAVAVHCRAGLGRTGTLISAYIMRHYQLSAREVLGWIRVCRPGSVTGIQQQYLDTLERRMMPPEDEGKVTDISRTRTGEFALAYQPHGAVGKDAYKPRDRSKTAKNAGGGGECPSPTRRPRPPARNSITAFDTSLTSMLGGGTFNNNFFAVAPAAGSGSISNNSTSNNNGIGAGVDSSATSRKRASFVRRDSMASFGVLSMDDNGLRSPTGVSASRHTTAFDRDYRSGPRRLSAIFAERTTLLQQQASHMAPRTSGSFLHARGGGSKQPSVSVAGSSGKNPGIAPLSLFDSQDIVPPPHDSGGALPGFAARRLSGSVANTALPGSPTFGANALSVNLAWGNAADTLGLDGGDENYPPSHYFLALEERQAGASVRQKKSEGRSPSSAAAAAATACGTPTNTAATLPRAHRDSLSSGQLSGDEADLKSIDSGGGYTTPARGQGRGGIVSATVSPPATAAVSVRSPHARRSTCGNAPLANAGRHSMGLITRYQVVRNRDRDREDSAGPPLAGLAEEIGGSFALLSAAPTPRQPSPLAPAANPVLIVSNNSSVMLTPAPTTRPPLKPSFLTRGGTATPCASPRAGGVNLLNSGNFTTLAIDSPDGASGGGGGGGGGGTNRNLFVSNQFVRLKATNAAWGAPVLKLGQLA